MITIGDGELVCVDKPVDIENRLNDRQEPRAQCERPPVMIDLEQRPCVVWVSDSDNSLEREPVLDEVDNNNRHRSDTRYHFEHSFE